MPPPVEALTRMCGVQVDGDNPPAGPEPDERGGLLRLGDQLPRLGVLEEGCGRGLAGLLHQHVRLAALRVPGERDALEGEFLGDEVGHHVAEEPEPGGQVDAYLCVVVGEVLRDVEVAARVGLLRQPERLMQASCSGPTHSRISSRRSRVRTMYVAVPTVRTEAAPIPAGSSAASAASRFPHSSVSSLILAGGVQIPGGQVAALRDPATKGEAEGQPWCLSTSGCSPAVFLVSTRLG